MACFVDEEVTFENVKKNLIAAGASEEDAAHSAAIVVDFIERSRERNGEYAPNEVPLPGNSIIANAKKESKEGIK